MLFIGLFTPAGQRVGQGATLIALNPGERFNGTIDDQADPSDPTSVAPIEPLTGPNGFVYGVDPTGTYQLITFQVDPATNKPPVNPVSSGIQLNSWSLDFAVPEPSAVTEADGSYAITGLPAGTHSVGVVPPPGGQVTSLGGAQFRTVSVGPNDNVRGIDFGVLCRPDLAGTVFRLRPGSHNWGDLVTIDYTISNLLPGDAGAFTVELRLSADGSIGVGDVPLQSFTVNSLAGLSSTAGSLTVRLPSTPPNGFATLPPENIALGFVIDPTDAVTEGDETNNASRGAGADLTYLAAPANQALTTGDGVQQFPSVAVDPKDPNHVAVAYVDFSLPLTSAPGAQVSRDAGYGGIAVKTSFDGGATWVTSVVPIPAGFDQGATYPTAKFDASGNLYVAFMAATFPGLPAADTGLIAGKLTAGQKPAITYPFNPLGGTDAGNERALGLASDNGVFVARSLDRGRTFAPGDVLTVQANRLSAQRPVNIVSVARASNTVTLTVSTPHDFIAGEFVTVAGLTNNSSLNGTYRVLSVTPTTIRYTLVGPAVATTAVSGQVTRSYVNYDTSPDLVIDTAEKLPSGAPNPNYGNVYVAETRYYAPGLFTQTARVTAVSRAANVVTVRTSAAHGYAVNDIVTLTGLVNNPSFNRTVQITAVTATRFTFTLAGPDVALTTDPGMVFRRSNSTGAGEIYLSVLKSGATNFVTRLTSSGASVLRDANLSAAQPPGTSVALDPKITVGPEGDLYVTQFAGGNFGIYYSNDTGNSFRLPDRSVLNLGQPFQQGATSRPPRTLDNNSFRTFPVRQLIADPAHPGVVYALEAIRVVNQFTGAQIDAAEVNFAYSSDYGLTWSRVFTVGENPSQFDEIPVGFRSEYRSTLNDDDGGRFLRFDEDLHDEVITGQALPKLAIDENGNLAVIWYDTRHDPANHLLDVFATSSTDGGHSFAANTPLTDSSFDANNGAFLDATGQLNYYLGDLIGLAAAGGVGYAAWTGTDQRTGNQDIYFARYSLAQPPAPPQDRFESNDTPASATDLGVLIGTSVQPRLAMDVHDEDWFQIRAAVTGKLTVSVSAQDLGHTLALELLDKDGHALIDAAGHPRVVVEPLFDDNGLLVGRRLELDVQTGERFLVHVTGSTPTPTLYTLSTTLLTQDLGERVAGGVEGSLKPLPRVVFPATSLQFTPGPFGIGDYVTPLTPVGVPSALTDLNIQIDVTNNTLGNMAVGLLTPAGSLVGSGATLFVLAPGERFNGVIDDEAATGIESAVAPYVGTFRPLEPLTGTSAQVSDVNTAGPYRLIFFLDDPAPAGIGLRSWSLDFAPARVEDRAVYRVRAGVTGTLDLTLSGLPDLAPNAYLDLTVLAGDGVTVLAHSSMDTNPVGTNPPSETITVPVEQGQEVLLLITSKPGTIQVGSGSLPRPQKILDPAVGGFRLDFVNRDQFSLPEDATLSHQVEIGNVPRGAESVTLPVTAGATGVLSASFGALDGGDVELQVLAADGKTVLPTTPRIVSPATSLQFTPGPAGIGGYVTPLTPTGVPSPISDLNVHIDVTNNTTGNMTVRLLTPAGLVKKSGAKLFTLQPGESFNGVIDDQAVSPISSGSAPYEGSYRPLESLAGPNSFVYGVNPAGTYQLAFSLDDPNPAGIGLRSWSLDFAPATVNVAVEKGQQLFFRLSRRATGTDANTGAFLYDVDRFFYLDYRNTFDFSPTGRPTLSFAAGGLPSDVVIGDLNHDGRPDLVITSSSISDEISVLIANADGTFQAPRRYAVGAGQDAVDNREAAINDVNGDGTPDLVVTNPLSADVSVLLGRGDGTFEPQRRFDTTFHAGSLGVADLNGDGFPDLVVGQNLLGTGNTSILMGRGDGTFLPQTILPAPFPAGVVSVRTGDLNGDGKLDVAVFGRNSGQVQLLFGAGDGTFPTSDTIDSGTISVTGELADLNGDGKVDLITGDLNTPTVYYRLSNGDGTFGPVLSKAVGVDPLKRGVFSIAFGDVGSETFGLDGRPVSGQPDGVPDLIVELGARNVNSPPLIVYVPALLSNGDLSFGTPHTMASSQVPRQLAVGDLNGDGKADVAATDLGGVQVIYSSAPKVQDNTKLATPRALGTSFHLVEAGLSIVPGKTDAYFAFTVPSEPLPQSGDQVIDFSALFDAMEGAGLRMEVLDASGKVLLAADRFTVNADAKQFGNRLRLVAAQDALLIIHVYALTDPVGPAGAGRFTLDINVLPQVVQVEAQAPLPGLAATSLVITLQGDRLDPTLAEDPGNYTVTLVTPEMTFVIPLGTGERPVVYNPVARVDVSTGGKNYPRNTQHEITLLFDHPLPPGTYRVTLSPNLQTADLNDAERGQLADSDAFGGHPVVNGAAPDKAGVALLLNGVVTAPGSGSLSQLPSGTPFLSQLQNDLGSLLDRLLVLFKDTPAVTDLMTDQVYSRLAAGVLPSRIPLVAYWLDPVSLSLADPQNRRTVYDQRTNEVSNRIPQTYVEVGGNVELVVSAGLQGSFTLNVNDVPPNARGGVVVLNAGEVQLYSLTEALRGGQTEFRVDVNGLVLPGGDGPGSGGGTGGPGSGGGTGGPGSGGGTGGPGSSGSSTSTGLQGLLATALLGLTVNVNASGIDSGSAGEGGGSTQFGGRLGGPPPSGYSVGGEGAGIDAERIGPGFLGFGATPLGQTVRSLLGAMSGGGSVGFIVDAVEALRRVAEDWFQRLPEAPEEGEVEVLAPQALDFALGLLAGPEAGPEAAEEARDIALFATEWRAPSDGANLAALLPGLLMTPWMLPLLQGLELAAPPRATEDGRERPALCDGDEGPSVAA